MTETFRINRTSMAVNSVYKHSVMPIQHHAIFQKYKIIVTNEIVKQHMQK